LNDQCGSFLCLITTVDSLLANASAISKAPMKVNLILLINLAAIAVMLSCLYLAITLRSRIPGGVVGKQWRFLTLLVSLFTVGYFCTPFFTMIPANVINLIVALIFFFGAIYVLITVRLIFRIIEELTT
jgi:hypothetical protein